MLLALRQGLDPVAKAQRPSSARGAIIGPPSGPPPSERRPGSARGPKPLTASEKKRFLLSGLHPPNTPHRLIEGAQIERDLAKQMLPPQLQPPPPPPPPPPEVVMPFSKQGPSRHRLADPEAAAAAEAAKAAVMRIVGEREAAVGALRALMPTPRGTVARRRATQNLIMSPKALSTARADMKILLEQIRRTSAAICAAIHEWKLVLRSRYMYFASLSDRQMSFYVGGINYLTKMTTDLAFLPAPSAQDPLLLHWFSEQLPWMLSSDPQLAAACLPLESIADLRAYGEEDGTPPDAVAQLMSAQKDLLEEAARNGTLVPPSSLHRLAKPPQLSPAGEKDEAVDAGARWQWEALQTVLYGSVTYKSLLTPLAGWFRNREIQHAASVIQEAYRTRKSRRLARIRRGASEKHHAMQAVEKVKAAGPRGVEAPEAVEEGARAPQDSTDVAWA